MTKLEVEKLLKDAGFKKHSGGNHDIWSKPEYPLIPVPRHKGDIPEGTLHKILKTAQLKKKK